MTKNNIIMIASGKGGVGKTWFAITFSHALAKMNRKVLLVDGDLGLANVDIQLGLVPKGDLSQYASGKRTLRDIITHYQDGGFDIIAGASGNGSLASLAPKRLQKMKEDLDELSKGYDHVILDIGAGIGGTVRSLMEVASSTLLVVTEDPTSLTDAYAFIKVMDKEMGSHLPEIVINMAETTERGTRTYETLLKACENFLKKSPPLAGLIRKDQHVQDSIRNQSPILIRFPICDAAEDVGTLAKTGTY